MCKSKGVSRNPWKFPSIRPWLVCKSSDFFLVVSQHCLQFPRNGSPKFQPTLKQANKMVSRFLLLVLFFTKKEAFKFYRIFCIHNTQLAKAGVVWYVMEKSVQEKMVRQGGYQNWSGWTNSRDWPEQFWYLKLVHPSAPLWTLFVAPYSLSLILTNLQWLQPLYFEWWGVSYDTLWVWMQCRSLLCQELKEDSSL